MSTLVIIPTYNEIENISDIISAVFDLEESFDILVVDDSSPDGTGDCVKALLKKYPRKLFLETRQEKDGLGKAYIHGFKWALKRGYDFIFEMDADFSHNPTDLPRLLEAAKKGAHLVIGSRYSHGVNVVNWPMSRVLLSYFASKYARFITGLPVSDSTAGFICYRKEALENINFDKIHFSGYGFQIEMKFRAWKNKLILQEIPIIFTDRTRGTSKMNKNIILEGIFGLIQLKIKSVFNLL